MDMCNPVVTAIALTVITVGAREVFYKPVIRNWLKEKKE